MLLLRVLLLLADCNMMVLMGGALVYSATQMLYESVIEVDERLQVISDPKRRVASDVRGISGDYIRVTKDLDVEDLRAKLQVRAVCFV